MLEDDIVPVELDIKLSVAPGDVYWPGMIILGSVLEEPDGAAM